MKYNSYDSAQPLKTQAYSSSMDLGTVEEEKDTATCDLSAAENFLSKSKISSDLISFHTIKPIDRKLLRDLFSGNRYRKFRISMNET